MRLPKFEFHAPETLKEAFGILAQYTTRTRVLAGGTDLLVNMKKRVLTPDHLVSISRIPELTTIEVSDDGMRIGACSTVADLCRSEAIRNTFPALAEGARNLGTPLIRNLATIGGNLGSARPAADLPPSLMVYGAQVVLKNLAGERKLPLDRFFIGPGLTEIQPDEILTGILVPAPPKRSGAWYINLGVRKGQDCNLVNAASWICLEADGRIRDVRIVLGCVGPVPLRAKSAEQRLIGSRPDGSVFSVAAEHAQRDCSPIDDFRASADYKRAMAGVLVRRTLEAAYRQAAQDGNKGENA
ncbi:FAD binding domain-containing protein [Desulfatirhabdium butyrativorans]|uniref:FAD binding domain-containing protein n=1 Tax=Desulfatirhabdium butyrativorans TaxID=340467 RepID=UPI0004025045|nr:xanthine dehydrogenase family protein subunit M [Desulfatirhabdium butyrativorans]